MDYINCPRSCSCFRILLRLTCRCLARDFLSSVAADLMRWWRLLKYGYYTDLDDGVGNGEVVGGIDSFSVDVFEIPRIQVGLQVKGGIEIVSDVESTRIWTCLG